MSRRSRRAKAGATSTRANEPQLIAGVGTYALEIFEDLPDVDYMFVPVGGGSGAAGCCIVRTSLGSRAKIIGVQASGPMPSPARGAAASASSASVPTRSPKAWRRA